MKLLKSNSTEDWRTASLILRKVAGDLDERGLALWRNDRISEEFLKSQYSSNELNLVEQNGHAIGVVFIQNRDHVFWPEITTDDTVFIHKLAVLPSFRRRGLGRRILEKIKNSAIENDKSWLRLDCFDRSSLVRFYESAGFSFVDRKIVMGSSVFRMQQPLRQC